MAEFANIEVATDRHGSTVDERIAQAQDRMSFWTRKLSDATASKKRAECEDCEAKLRYWSMRLRTLEERVARTHDEVAT